MLQNIFNQVDSTYNPELIIWYWSWVKEQEWYSNDEKRMIDFIFWVDSSSEFHETNIQNNSDDYSFLSKFLPKKVLNYFQKTGWKIYYNPYLNFWESEIKYGVISINDLKNDLENWSELYVAWRLQKPVEIVKCPKQLEVSLQKNLENAVNVALILIWEETISEEDLFLKIAWLSYTWDSREWIWEDPNKVRNIVSKNINWFRKLYLSIVEKSELVEEYDLENQLIRVGKIKTQKAKDLLPIGIRDKINLDEITHIWELRSNIEKAISEIVSSTSIAQTVKWVYSSWICKSIRYWLEKMKKAQKWKKKIK